MCYFFSVILTSRGRLFYNLDLQNHEQIINYYNIRDSVSSNFRQDLVRLRYAPQTGKDIAEKTNWRLVDDHCGLVHWLDKKKISEKLWNIVNRLIVRTDRDTLSTGHYIIPPKVIIGRLINSKILYMCGDSCILNVHGACIIDKMKDTSSIETIQGTSMIKIIKDHSSVFEMIGSSRVQTMTNYSHVQTMRDFSTVENMKGFSTIENMYDDSKVLVKYNEAKIINDYR